MSAGWCLDVCWGKGGGKDEQAVGGRSATSTNSAEATCPAGGTPPGLPPQFTPEVYADEKRKISVSQIRKGLSRRSAEQGKGREDDRADANQGNASLPPRGV